MAKLSIASAVDWVSHGLDTLAETAAKVTGVTGGLKQIVDTIKPPVVQASGAAQTVRPGSATEAASEPFKYMPVILIAGFIIFIYIAFKNR